MQISGLKPPPPPPPPAPPPEGIKEFALTTPRTRDRLLEPRSRKSVCSARRLWYQTDTSTTASGSPEIIVSGARPETVKPKIINAVLDLGMTLKNDTPIEVTAERPWKMTPESGVVTLLPDLDGSAVVERRTFSMTDSSGGTRVMLDRYMVRTSRL